MYPIKLKAPLKDYIWGGKRLKTDFNKQSDMERVAESWELSCHKDGTSIIANGEFEGMLFTDFIKNQSEEILGNDCNRFDNFPILIKLIDACDNLSLQVHPENEYALRVEGEYGKTEMWYIVDCDEGASLLYGFKQAITTDEFKRRISDNTILEVVNRVPVKKGDVFFIEAGTLHGIGSGIVIAEIQQNSNTTYRIYDYGRVGNDGNPRELHVDKAIDVTKLCEPPKTVESPVISGDGYIAQKLSSCEYFTVEALHINKKYDGNVKGDSFHSLLCTEGCFTLKSEHGKIDIAKGDSVFLQANYGDYTVIGSGEIIKTTV